MTSTRTDPLGFVVATARPGLTAVLRQASATALAIALVCTASPRAAWAAPEATPPTDAKPESKASPSPAESEPTVESALASGDLTTALSLAKAAREADPSPRNWHREAEVLEEAGHFSAAEDAYRSELEALPEDAKTARAAVTEDLERVRTRARAVVADEPASKHRAELDAIWGPESPKSPPKPRIAVNPPPPEPADRIVTKWYFWVTVGAIVAAAGAVTGIAIQASREQRSDALDALEQSPTVGPTLFRF